MTDTHGRAHRLGEADHDILSHSRELMGGFGVVGGIGAGAVHAMRRPGRAPVRPQPFG
ncbi:hypothetical protein QNO09_36165 [Streptomyces sp. 378]|uniref:hypothetical protein n=1 Tax=Streptomyces sp. 378 TaxID=3049412 RepID=UPI0024C2F746|nr:hypothetical protein [Streptomyces sp. 378]MDK1348610.1 hypothetical protein [Streptomyces sp. 378]